MKSKELQLKIELAPSTSWYDKLDTLHVAAHGYASLSQIAVSGNFAYPPAVIHNRFHDVLENAFIVILPTFPQQW